MRKKGKELDPNKTFFLFCEGLTEVCYFNALKEKFENIRIKTELKGQIPCSIAKINEFKKILYKKTGYTKNSFSYTKSKIFVLIDIDIREYSQETVDFIKNNLEDENIIVICSNLDVELWILLHFALYKKEENRYIDEISRLSGKDYKKGATLGSLIFFREIINNSLDNAVSNSIKLERFNLSQGKTKLKEMLPYTEVYKIIEELKK